MLSDISVIIVAKDHPPHIFETIHSVEGFVSEIIIVDIGMSVFLKEKLGSMAKVRIESIGREAVYVELIREEVKQYAKHDWIFILDPDEVVQKALKQLIGENLTHYDYFSIPRKNIIFGKWIQHSRWWPDHHVRLFKKKSAIWPIHIHSKPELKGRGYTVPSEEIYALIHYNYESLDEFIQKLTRYTKAEAHERIKNNQYFSLPDALRKSLSEFISRYFAKEGYKDGVHGFVLAVLQMFYYLLVYFYYWEGKKYAAVDQQKMVKEVRSFFNQGLYETNYWLLQNKLIPKVKRLTFKLQNIALRFFK